MRDQSHGRTSHLLVVTKDGGHFYQPVDQPFPAHVHPQNIELIKPANHVHLHIQRADSSEEHYHFHNSRVDAGANAVANNISGTQVAVFTYIAFSADTTAVAKGDTTLASEITTGGLGRAAGTFGSYTAPTTLGGTASYTLTKSFSATAAYTIQKIALFNASSAGTMLFETGSLGITGNNGDTINVTWTVNE